MQLASKLPARDLIKIILVILAVIYLLYFGYTRVLTRIEAPVQTQADDTGQIVQPVENRQSAFKLSKLLFNDITLSIEKRVDDLIARLTLEEVVQQSIAEYTKPTPAIDRLGIKPFVWISECLHGQYRTYGTSFPQALGLAASFSDELVYDVAEAVGTEVRAHWNEKKGRGTYRSYFGPNCFSPVVNIMRHPYWGRNQETYGEDPFLSGTLAQSFIKGMQGNHTTYTRVSAGCKHFDAHGGPENIPVPRFTFNSQVSTSDWRMTYLPAFKMCVEAGSTSLMCSYNKINGVPACANRQLLTDIARKEWGFKGFVVSDAHAISNLHTQQHYASDEGDAAVRAVQAGCNLELGSSLYTKHTDAVKAGKLSEQELRQNIKPLFLTRMKLGEFDPPEKNPYESLSKKDVQSKKHQELAVKAAMMSFVLLKNSANTLPLQKHYKSIAVIGPFSHTKSQMFGNWSPKVSQEYTKTVREALSQLADTVTHADGCREPSCRDFSQENVLSAVKDAEVVVVCLGVGRAEGEGTGDRRSLSLPGKQLDLLKYAVQVADGARMVVLLFNAGPVDVSWAQEETGVSVILACFYPGQAAGEAVYRSLTNLGRHAAPAGRLPATWPASDSQVLPMTNYSMEGRTYRYIRDVPLYPFGYGLSYTQFNYEGLRAEQASANGNLTITVSVTVKNIGKLDNDEVIQVYVGRKDRQVPFPKYQLAGFKRVHLPANSEKTVTFTVSAGSLSIWREERWDVPIGNFFLYVGGQQPAQKRNAGSNVLKATLTVL